MIIRLAILVSAIAVMLTISVGLGTVSTAGNSVPVSVASLSHHAVRPSQVTPAECSGLPLERIFVGGRTVKGRGSNDLLIADYRTRKLVGKNGSDCLIAAPDYRGELNGGKHSDICIGGAKTKFKNCEVEIIR